MTGLDALRALGLAVLVRRRSRFLIGATKTKKSSPFKGLLFLVPVTGLEPVRRKTARDFKSLVSTIPPHRHVYDKLTLIPESVKNLDVD